MKGKKYYSVIADNGFMVSSSWSHVLEMRPYFRGDNAKSFKSREEAIIATRTGFNERHEFIKYFDEIKLNEPYFTKNMIHENQCKIKDNEIHTMSKINSTPMVTIE